METEAKYEADIEAAHRDLSEVDWQFREMARHDPEYLRRSTFGVLDTITTEAGIHGRIQPWPTFIEGRRLEDLSRVALGLTRLVKSLPQRWFHNDPHKICDYYATGNPQLAALVLSPPNGIAESIARGDFILGESGFQCLELNMGGNIGGAELGESAELLVGVPRIRRFLDRLDRPTTVRRSMWLLFLHILRNALAAGLCAESRANVVLAVESGTTVPTDPGYLAFVDREYEAALEEIDAGLSGSVLLSNYSDFELRGNGLYCRGSRVHALVEVHPTPTEKIVFRPFKSGLLQLYNGPVSWLLSDKRNLALLSELGESGFFDEAENELVRRHVPWTRRLFDAPCTFRGERRPLRDLLTAEREHMVIKHALSYGGHHVILGRITPPDVWEHKVDAAIRQGGWIAQEFVASRSFLFQEGEEGSSPHDVIWGPLVFGDTYAGAMLRTSPQADQGVVSVSLGAMESILIEVGP